MTQEREIMLVFYNAGENTYQVGDLLPLYDNGQCQIYMITGIDKQDGKIVYMVRPI